MLNSIREKLNFSGLICRYNRNHQKLIRKSQELNTYYIFTEKENYKIQFGRDRSKVFFFNLNVILNN